MKVLKLFESIILDEDIEAVRKNYPNISDEDFDKIIRIDPTFKEDKNSVGTYGKWLLTQEQKNHFLTNSDVDLLDLSLSLEQYDKLKKDRTKDIEKDINKFKTIDDLNNAIANVSDAELSDRQKLRQMKSNKDYEVIYKSPEWTIYMPLTWEGDVQLGAGSGWCTADSREEYGKKFYNNYLKEYGGHYYILINNDDPKIKYQFHRESNQYFQGKFMSEGEIRLDSFDMAIRLYPYPDVVKKFRELGYYFDTKGYAIEEFENWRILPKNNIEYLKDTDNFAYKLLQFDRRMGEFFSQITGEILSEEELLNNLSFNEEEISYFSLNKYFKNQKLDKKQIDFNTLQFESMDLLSGREARQIPISIRQYAEPYSKWWWLRTPGDSDDCAAFVDYEGQISWQGDIVINPNVCVRPVLTISNIFSFNPDIGDVVKIDNEDWIVINDHQVLYKGDPIYHQFDSKSNNYETSEIKSYIDSWLAHLISLQNKNESINSFKFKKNLNEEIDETLLTEDIEAVKRQYSHIPEEDFDKIIRLDPTFKEERDSVGTYGKWLLGLYKKDNPLNHEDITELLSMYNEYKTSRDKKIEKDVNKFKSVEDLKNALDTVEDAELTDRQKLRKNRASKDYKIVYEDNDWTIYVPLTWEGDVALGTGTEWCTADSREEYGKMNYNKYLDQYGGEYYVLISKQDPSDKYQFHFESDQYMDKYDYDIFRDMFMERYPKVEEFFVELGKIKQYKTIDISKLDLDLISMDLLSIDEAKKITKSFRKYGFDDCWWLRSPGTFPNTIISVFEDGSIYSPGIDVQDDNVCVRPALTISNLDSFNLEVKDEIIIDGQNWIVINDHQILYNGELIYHNFDKESTDYETSEIKSYLDKWFNKIKNKQKTTANESIKFFKFKRNLKEENELKKRARWAKKRQKGRSPFMRVDAGDVEKNIEMFNKATNTGDITTLANGDNGVATSGGMAESLKLKNLIDF